MVKQFFASIFGLFFTIIILLNVLMHFNIAPYGDVNNAYFGISTIIDIFAVDNYQEGTLPYFIAQGQVAINDALTSLSKEMVDRFGYMLKNFSGKQEYLPYVEIEGIGTFFLAIWTFLNNVGYFFSGFGSLIVLILESIAFVFTFLSSLALYLVYLIACLSALLSGSYYNTMPIGSWSYPELVHGLTPVFTI